MNTISLSAHSLDKAACARRYWYYRVAGRSLAGAAPALCQGIAGHGALARWRRGEPEAEQRRYIDLVFAAHEVPPDDFRSPSYLAEALAQYRAEFQEPTHWEFLEVEKPFDLVLGTVVTRRLGEVEVHWTGRRDAVIQTRDTGQRFVLDNKFVSRDETVELAVAQNSRALKGYVWSWNHEHAETPVQGAIMRRTVIRKPTKDKPVNVTLPLDPPIYFPDSRIEEWRQDTLHLAAVLLERDPANLRYWPQEESCCRHTFGACDYLPVCTLPPEDREIKLASDMYKDAGERFEFEKDEAP